MVLRGDCSVETHEESKAVPPGGLVPELKLSVMQAVVRCDAKGVAFGALVF